MISRTSRDRRCRALVAAAASVLYLAACSGPDDERLSEGRIEVVAGFAGVVAGDEPRATLVGRDILASNGNAVDAAVAMAFAMSVTMPSRVGLGGGGACLVHKRQARSVTALEFLPDPTAEGGSIPGLARGMAALHARSGLQDWRMLVAPAEQLARFGYSVSRAFREDLEAGLERIRPEVRGRYLDSDGDRPAVGDRLRNPSLSATLAGLRTQGAGYLYGGAFARRLTEASAEAGQPFTVEDLRRYTAGFADTLKLEVGSHELHLAPPPVLGGLAAAQYRTMLRVLEAQDGPVDAERAHLAVEAWKRVLSERRAWRDTPAGRRDEPAALVREPHLRPRIESIGAAATPVGRLDPAPAATGFAAPTAGFVVADRFGNLVACDFTMNGLFGSGVEAAGTGILLSARAPKAISGAGLSPAIIANRHTGQGLLAVSAAGGTSGQTALVHLVRRLEDFPEQGIDLKGLLGEPRLHHPGRPDQVLAEPEVGPAVITGLRARDHDVVQRMDPGRLQSLYCARGPRESRGRCQAASDPRGHGLAVVAQ